MNDQDVTRLTNQLAPLVRSLRAVAYSSPDDVPWDVTGGESKGKGRAEEEEGRAKLVEWLSDWHLIAFLDTVGIFQPVSSTYNF